MSAQQFIAAITQNPDLDLYDKSGFLRFRSVEGGTIRVWKNGTFHGDVSPQEAVKFIENRTQNGFSEMEDLKLISPEH